MLRELSEEVRVALKDRLRDVRHVIRQHRHDGAGQPVRLRPPDLLPVPLPPWPTRGLEGLVGHAVSAFDDAITLAETLAPIERPGAAGNVVARGFAFYFPAGEGDDAFAAARAFRRDLYHLAKQVLAKSKVAARIRESEFAAVHAAMRQRHGDLLAALAGEPAWPQRVSAAAALCAALLVELLDHRPLRFDSAEEEAGGREAELLCLAPVALACGVATVDPDGAPEPDLLDITTLAAEARLDRIRPACAGADAQGELTRIFATLLAHLP